MVLYGPVWFNMVRYKHIGSPQATLVSKNGNATIEKNDQKIKNGKISRIENMINKLGLRCGKLRQA